MAHKSNSEEQQAAEPIILAGAAAQLGVNLAPAALKLPGGAQVRVDGVADDGSVLVEVFAHQGLLRGAQFHKVARDALKLITVARGRGFGTRLVIAFGDVAAADCVTGKSWLAEALRTWDVEVVVVDIEDELRATVASAQLRQIMVNPAAPGDVS